MWHGTCDMWHVTHEMWHTGDGEHCFKISGPLLKCFGIYDILKIWLNWVTYLINQLINNVFVEQPRLNRDC